MTDGIDIASYQSTSYDTAGLGFVLVKATEGTGYTNPRHAGQVATGRAHALVVGHYHFVRPGPMTAQAAYFLQHAAPQPGEILALDWEDTGVSGAEKDAWIRHVQATAPGHRVILYCNRDFWLNRDTTSFCGDGLWIADPSAPKGQPRITSDWLIHQYSEAAGLDRDYTRLTAAQLAAWARMEDDDMPSADDFVEALLDAKIISRFRTGPDGKPAQISVRTFFEFMDAHYDGTIKAVAGVGAQVGSLNATLAALQKDGNLTATELQAVAAAGGEAGARAALAELGKSLTDQTPED